MQPGCIFSLCNRRLDSTGCQLVEFLLYFCVILQHLQVLAGLRVEAANVNFVYCDFPQFIAVNHHFIANRLAISANLTGFNHRLMADSISLLCYCCLDAPKSACRHVSGRRAVPHLQSNFGSSAVVCPAMWCKEVLTNKCSATERIRFQWQWCSAPRRQYQITPCIWCAHWTRNALKGAMTRSNCHSLSLWRAGSLPASFNSCGLSPVATFFMVFHVASDTGTNAGFGKIKACSRLCWLNTESVIRRRNQQLWAACWEGFGLIWAY